MRGAEECAFFPMGKGKEAISKWRDGLIIHSVTSRDVC